MILLFFDDILYFVVFIEIGLLYVEVRLVFFVFVFDIFIIVIFFDVDLFVVFSLGCGVIVLILEIVFIDFFVRFIEFFWVIFVVIVFVVVFLIDDRLFFKLIDFFVGLLMLLIIFVL